MNDLYDSSMTNDKFSLLCESNKKANIAVKVPGSGLSDRFEVESVIMQGGNWGPLQCSVQMDKLGKESLETGENLFKYKNCLDISSLEMIDDVAALAKCGIDSLITNTYITTKVKANKLEFGEDNCKVMHIGTPAGSKCECPVLKVQDVEMSETECQKYLGDVLSRSGSNERNIDERVKKGTGIIAQVLALLKEISWGTHLSLIHI